VVGVGVLLLLLLRVVPLCLRHQRTTSHLGRP